MSVKMTRCLLLMCFIFSLSHCRRPASFRIGSVFLERDLLIHQAFGSIRDEINADDHYLNGTRLDYNIQYSQPDQFDAYQKICMEMTYRVVAVFGSSPSSVDSSVASVCSALSVPYLTTHPVMTPNNVESRAFAVHLGPSQNDLIAAVTQVANELQWTELALISHRETASLDAQQLMELLQSSGINVRLLDLKRGDIRPGLATLRNRGIKNFLVDIGDEYLELFFDQAMKAGIVHQESAFLAASLDLTTVSMENLRHTGSAIMGFSILNQSMVQLAKSTGEMSAELGGLVSESHRAALLYDGVHLFTKAVENLINGTDLTNPKVSCDNRESPYELGVRLLKEINAVVHDGLTGRITMKNGRRQTVNLAIIKLGYAGEFKTIGKWSKNNELTIVELDLATFDQDEEMSFANGTPRKPQSLSSRPLLVRTRTTDLPYMKKDADSALPTYHGFLKDLLDQLSVDLQFEYKLQVEEELHHGSLDHESGNWSGIIGKLVDQEADLGLDDLTVTSERSRVVDFSPPYETSKLTILLQKRASEEAGMSVKSFFEPFSVQVWMSIGIAYILTSLLVFVVARVSPYERHSHTKSSGHCDDNALGLSNAFWFTLSGFFLRSTSISPKSLSTRLLTAFWWLFCLVMLFIYIISLRTLIFPSDSSKSEMTIEQVLRNNNNLELAVFPKGSTHLLLTTSKDPVHQAIWAKVNMAKSRHLQSLQDVVDLVANDRHFGFVIESVQAEGLMRDRCDLMTVGDLGSRHYALAFPKGSRHRDQISRQILKYNEEGLLYKLKRKWFNHTQDCALKANQGEDNPIVRALPYHGPFLLLLCAGVTSLVLAFIELLFYAFLRSRRSTLCLPNGGPTGSRGGKACSIVKEELCSAVKCAPKPAQTGQLTNNGGNNGIHMTSGVYHRYGGSSVKNNGDVVVSSNSNGGHNNGNNKGSFKNGHNFYQAQALLRKDGIDDDNAQL